MQSCCATKESKVFFMFSEHLEQVRTSTEQLSRSSHFAQLDAICDSRSATQKRLFAVMIYLLGTDHIDKIPFISEFEFWEIFVMSA